MLDVVQGAGVRQQRQAASCREVMWGRGGRVGVLWGGEGLLVLKVKWRREWRELGGWGEVTRFFMMGGEGGMRHEW